ncbi:MAG TPA: class I SAM-dependent methyltransferase [Gaiellaceae bacterium]|nr:class I SAM-dependent methyltransferase [Gaiellaceae bacterium]
MVGRARRRVGRALASPPDERSVTAEHWGDEARTKVEGDEWQGLYWQSHALTQRHINRAISGADENWVDFTKRRFFPQRAHLALSLGSGYGVLERHALAVDMAERFDAFDISPEAVEIAREEAERGGYGDRIAYEARDLNAIELEPGRYDAVFATQTLHHIEALEHLLDQVRASLTPRGLLVVNEYVGPVRFQFPDERLPLMNELLLALPETHRRNLRTGDLISEIVRPDEREVKRVDPSESVRSDEIIGLIDERFEIVHRADFGGTLLQFVLADIAGNFDPADPKDVAMIDLVCLYEKTLIDEGVLPSDFVYLVARRRAL